MTAIAYQNFQKTIEAFYLKITKDHSLKFTLRNRFKTLNTNLQKDFNLLPEIEFKTMPPKSRSQNQIKQEEPEFMSVRRPHQLQTLNISKSRSVLQKSSKDATQKDAKQFNSQWVYQSDQSSKILFFAIILSLILNDNKLSFKYFQDKINDQLDETKDFTDYELSTIARQWQLIGTLFLKSRPVKWKLTLREAINKLSLKFIKLTCKMMLQLTDTPPDLFTTPNLTKLSKQMKVNISFFTINYKEIESVDNIGKFSQQICIGKLKHKNSYVIANQTPQYSPEQKTLRDIRSNFAKTVAELIDVYGKNSEQIAIESNSKVLKEKELVARQFLANCLKQ